MAASAGARWLAALAAAALATAAGPPRLDPETLRERMVDRQIAARGVENERVLDAMRTVPRHLFVPLAQREHAYQEKPESPQPKPPATDRCER